MGSRARIVQIASQPNRELSLYSNSLRTSWIRSAFAEAYPDTVDEKFAQHWDTWFTQSHVDQLSAAGINTVRVPVCMHLNIIFYLDRTRWSSSSDTGLLKHSLTAGQNRTLVEVLRIWYVLQRMKLQNLNMDGFDSVVAWDG